MKNKIIKLFSTTLILFIVTFFAFACTDKDAFALKQKKYWLDRYEETVVELSKGDRESLTWTSNDEAIVTVEDGKLIAQGEGKTTVSVSDGKKTETIQVTVLDSGVEPEIAFTELNAYIGVETQIPEVLNYAGEEMQTSIEYTLDLEDDSYLRIDGNKIEGLKLGEVKGTISAQWKGLELSQEITFYIYNSVYMTTDSESVEIHNVDSKLGRAPLGIHLFELETEISELIEYTVASGEDVVRVENGTVYAKAEGQAEVVASYTKYGINATASVQVNVLPNYVEAEMIKPATPYKITYEKYTGTVGGRQSDNMYAYCAGETVKSDNCFEHRVVNKDVDVKVMDLYRQGYRYFTFDVYYTSNENLMVGCHNKTYWLSVGSIFRSDYLKIITDGEVTNCLQKNKWNTLCYDLKGLWEITYGLPANIFFFTNDKTATSYLMNVRYYLDDKFIPDENRVYEDKGDYVQATNDEFDIAVPVSKSYSTTTDEPAIVVTKDSVPRYMPYNIEVGGRTDAYLYYTQSRGAETNALVVSTSLNTTYADGIWRMSQKGDYLAWDIYPEEGSSITFKINGGKTTFTAKVGETNLFEEESWLTVIKDGEKQGVLTAGEWQTVVIAFVDNYDDSSLMSNITFAVNEPDVYTYVSNVRYYKNNSFIPTAYADETCAPYVVEDSANATLNRVETGSFKGSYEYINASNFDGAVSFKGIKTEENTAGEFFAQGYKFVKYAFYLDSNVQSLTVKTAELNATLNVGGTLADNGIYVFNADETNATSLELEKWYTLYIPVNNSENPDVRFSINGTQAKAYIKYVTFEYAINVPTLKQISNVAHLISLEYQKDGTFAGSWKYVNKSCGADEGTTKNWGESGVCFSRVCDATTNKPGAYFKENYKWVKADFYMTDSVRTFSIRFSKGKNNAYWITNIRLNALVAENIYVTDLDGDRLNVIPSNEWFTLYIPAEGLSADDNYYMVSVYTDGGSEQNPAVAYVKNIEYLKEYDVPEYPKTPTGAIAVGLHLRQENSVIPTGMSLEKETSGDFAGAYKYVNGLLGRAGGKYGEHGVYFEEIWNANLGYKEGTQKFFESGYQYVKLDFYATETVYSIDFRHGLNANEGWLMESKAGSIFTSSIFTIYDKDGGKVNKWTAGEWYTLVIKPIEKNFLSIQTNAQTATSEAPVMYIKNLSYSMVNPITMKPTIVVNTAKNTTLEKETSGDFAGAYKYTNNSLGTVGGMWGDAGIYFNEIYPLTGGHSTAFHDEGYQYVKLDFYATETVFSISFTENFMNSTARVFTVTSGQLLSSNAIFTIYDKDGNKVNRWSANAWYTLVIKPSVATQGDYAYPLRIQTNAQTSASSAPVMYIKNVSYEKENPFQSSGESAYLYVRNDKATYASVVYQTEGEFANTWKYTNVSNKSGVSNQMAEAQCGFMFDQLQQSSGERVSTFFENGYQYISLQFCVMTDTVDSLDLRYESKTDRYFMDNSREYWCGDVFTLYDAQGNKVTGKLTAGEWYTMVIKPGKDSTGKANGIYINLRETDASQDSPVMYIKNPTYLVNNPMA